MEHGPASAPRRRAPLPSHSLPPPPPFHVVGFPCRNEIVQWVKKKTGPPSAAVDTAEALEAAVKDQTVWLVGFFEKFEGDEHEKFESGEPFGGGSHAWAAGFGLYVMFAASGCQEGTHGARMTQGTHGALSRDRWVAGAWRPVGLPHLGPVHHPGAQGAW